ncbi:MAG TPA: hypothetical protein VF226_18730 [Hyphomicrobiaceae bacterium]
MQQAAVRQAGQLVVIGNATRPDQSFCKPCHFLPERPILSQQCVEQADERFEALHE